MGALGNYLGASSIFLVAAALSVRALLTLSFIRSDEINYARARNAETHEGVSTVHGIIAAGEKPAAALVYRLFGPVPNGRCVDAPACRRAHWKREIGTGLPAHVRLDCCSADSGGNLRSLERLFFGTLGAQADTSRRFCVEIVRAALLSVIDNPILWIPVQLLDGITGAIVTVLTVVIVMDLTTGTGRFNLARGFVGLVSTIAAAVSLIVFGFIAQEIGNWAGFVSTAAVTA